jgi:hypothetical protein
MVTKSKPPEGFAGGYVCYKHTGGSNNGEVFTKSCNDTVGRYVGVRIVDKSVLELCEVEVEIGPSEGSYIRYEACCTLHIHESASEFISSYYYVGPLIDTKKVMPPL